MQVLHKLLLLHVLTCLGRNALGAKIISGVKVPDDKMQYMASLQDYNGHHFCGGSLITDEFVLTAAHCDTTGPVRVVLGTHNLGNTGTVRNIVQRCKHPNYRGTSTGSDIMLLKLSQSVPLGGTIQRIQLASANRTLKPDEKCSVAGWGVTEDSDEQAVPDLRVVGVSVVDQNVCRQQWSNSGLILRLPANVICAGGYRTFNGSCKGDSGGPLVCNGVAVGVVSFGDPCCRDRRLPDVYTDVSKFYTWIDQIVRQNRC